MCVVFLSYCDSCTTIILHNFANTDKVVICPMLRDKAGETCNWNSRVMVILAKSRLNYDSFVISRRKTNNQYMHFTAEPIIHFPY